MWTKQFPSEGTGPSVSPVTRTLGTSLRPSSCLPACYQTLYLRGVAPLLPEPSMASMILTPVYLDGLLIEWNGLCFSFLQSVFCVASICPETGPGITELQCVPFSGASPTLIDSGHQNSLSRGHR